jgi:hypothetical protein
VVTEAVQVRSLLQAAEQLSLAVANRLPALLPCAPSPAARAEQDSCASAFIARFARRAFRRPLAPVEADRLLALYRAERDGEAAEGFEEAIGDLITAILQAPEFLYHREQGLTAPVRDGALVRLNDHELASRLSYLFWGSMPDDELFAAADAGMLSRPEQRVAQARRLLADPRARLAIEDFHRQWLEVDRLDESAKDPLLFPFYSPEVARSMIAENGAFATHLLLGPDATGKLGDLLQASATFIDANLAKVYGVAAPASPGLQPVKLDPTRRAGLFTQPSFLSATSDDQESHPTHRGAAVMRRVLCLELSPPDSIIIPPLPERPTAGLTTRERYETLDADQCAASCHGVMDPLGYAFENYDAIGAYRTLDNNKPVNARASVALPSGQRLEYDDAIALMAKLAKLDEVRECMGTQWLRYFLGRREVTGEAPSVRALAGVLHDSGDDLRALLVALTRTRTFTHRAPFTGEVMP